VRKGILSPLSQESQELLAAEREIPPVSEPLRRRADLRARTALWHVRRGASIDAGAVPWFKRLSLVAVGLLVPSLSFAAWVALERPSAPAASSVETTVAESAPIVEGDQRTEPLEIITAPQAETSASEAREVQLRPSPATPPADVAGGRATPVKRKPGAGASVTPSRSSEPQADELAMLDAARKAVVRGEYSTALRELKRHQRRFPNSQLSEERDALHVRALDGAGLDDQASRAASGFESRHPDSVLVPSLKRSK
jgi:hypothetical protein